jgi:predicted RNA methylase
MLTTTRLEEKRLLLQRRLDKRKSQKERNQLGQFATPPGLARSIVKHGISLLGNNKNIHFLDPAFGTGSFYSALLDIQTTENIVKSRGFEIDPDCGEAAKELWKDTSLDLQILDFTSLPASKQQSERFNLIICNPPYVRHHHLSRAEKVRLQELTLDTCGMRISGLAGLYCYFLCMAHYWMMNGGIAGWLIPSEFMDVEYGKAIKHYLLNKVTLLQIHRFDSRDVQFDEALVSSTIVWIKNEPPQPNSQVLFTFGNSLSSPNLSKSIDVSVLKTEPKWTRFPALPVRIRSNVNDFYLSDLFEIKRGIATGDNKFFILNEKQIKEYKIPNRFLKPILPSSRYLSTDEIEADNQGIPILERRLFLLDCNLPEDEVKTTYPQLWDYLKLGQGTVSERYLCRHRKIWYSQEKRSPAPILCTYLGRKKNQDSRTFRFILNSSKAVAPNVYLLLYPREIIAQPIARDSSMIRKIWEVLRTLDPNTILAEGRGYGGGLHKIEPKELGRVNATRVIDVLPATAKPTKIVQHSLF